MKVSSILSLGYFPSSAANFTPADRWNWKSQIIPKLGRILKFKPQQCYKLIKTLLQTENEGKLGFELWPRFADFARYFCAFALNLKKLILTIPVLISPKPSKKEKLIRKAFFFFRYSLVVAADRFEIPKPTLTNPNMFILRKSNSHSWAWDTCDYTRVGSASFTWKTALRRSKKYFVVNLPANTISSQTTPTTPPWHSSYHGPWVQLRREEAP